MAQAPRASRRSMYDRGYAHFLQGKVSPSRIIQTYPTRDRHSAAEEAEFIAGFEEARRDDALAATTRQILNTGD